MNAAPTLLALLAGLLVQGVAFGYEEGSGASKSDLFFARVGEPTTVSLPNGADAAKLQASCKSGQLYRVESSPPTCKCTADLAESRRPKELTITLHCQTANGRPQQGSLVLVSESRLTFDDDPLDETRRLDASSAQPILAFLKSVDPEVRKRRTVNSIPVYSVREGAQQFWLAHTGTIAFEEAGCSQKKYQVVTKRGETFVLAGKAHDIESLVSLKPDGKVLLRSSNQCDGVQADLYTLTPKVDLRATFSGH